MLEHQLTNIIKRIENYNFCYNMNDNVQKVENFIKQPIILVPLPSPICNQRWDYKLNGDNWDCLCK